MKIGKFNVYRNSSSLFMLAVVYSCLAQYIDEKQDIEHKNTIYSIGREEL